MSKSVFESLDELSLSDLSAVRGGQSAQAQTTQAKDDATDALTDFGDAVIPYFAPVRAAVRLAYAGDRYFKAAYEHQYPTVSDHHAQQAEQQKADHAKQEQADREHQLQSSKPTGAGDVAVWLDAGNP